MSAFAGRQGKGAMRRHREAKRAEAMARQSQVAHERTKAHRLRCGRECELITTIFGGAR